MATEISAKQLEEVIFSLNKSLNKSNSLGWRFLLGLVQGVGATLGATIVATIVIAILAQSVKTLSDAPILGKLLNSAQVERYIQQ